MRLIDADAFRREIDNHWPFTREEQSKHGIADMAKSTLLYVLNTMPTIEERKTGKWNFVGNQMFECTSCGVAYTEYQFEKMRVRYNDPKFPRFCPNCGAGMEVLSDE